MSLSSLLKPDKQWMKQALREAEKAADAGEVPVGAVVVHGGHLVGRGHNMVERLSDATAHAELIAITAASESLGSKYLTDCTLYVTLEPCPMCAGAIVWSKIPRLVFGAYDERAGACSSLYNITQDTRLNHRTELLAGVEEAACSELIKAFFAERRRKEAVTTNGDSIENG